MERKEETHYYNQAIVGIHEPISFTKSILTTPQRKVLNYTQYPATPPHKTRGINDVNHTEFNNKHHTEGIQPKIPQKETLDHDRYHT